VNFRNEKFADNLPAHLLLLGVSLVLSVLAAEGSMRLAFRHITTTTDNSSYFARRWRKNHVVLNRWGFREREIVLKKSESIYRIAVIGDSFTFGQGIAEEDRFSRLLEQRLNALQGGYEVMSFGKSGANTIHHTAYLRGMVLKVDPDFVLLQWYQNDYQVPAKEKGPSMKLPWNVLVKRYLHENSALYYLLKVQWSKLRSLRPRSRHDPEGEILKKFDEPDSAESLSYTKRLKEFISLCVANDIPTGVVLFPHTDNPKRETYRYAGLHNVVTKAFGEEGFMAVDLRSAFAPYVEDFGPLSVNQFDGHPNDMANRIAADQLMETFGDFWLSRKKGRMSQ